MTQHLSCPSRWLILALVLIVNISSTKGSEGRTSLDDTERLLLLDDVPYGDDEDVLQDDQEVGGPLLEDTPSPPVILEDGEEEYLEYHYESMVEKELRDIHRRLFSEELASGSSKLPVREGSSSSKLSVREDSRSNKLPVRDGNSLNTASLTDLFRDNPDFQFEPPKVEITAIVSHSPQREDDIPETSSVQEISGESKRHSSRQTEEKTTQVSPISSVPVDDLSIYLNWWQILLIVLASVLLASLCCYFTGCCFITVDCCSDPYWGCCPCCSRCVRPLKPPPHGKSAWKEVQHHHISTAYSLNENSTAPRRSVERSNISLPDTVRSVNGRGSYRSISGAGSRISMNGPLPPPAKPERMSRSSSSSARNIAASAVSSPASGGSVRNITGVSSCSQEEEAALIMRGSRNYRRSRSGEEMATRPGACPAGETATTNQRTTVESTANQKASRQPAINQRNGGDSSYFSWLHMLGKRRRCYDVSSSMNPEKNNQNIYRQNTKYRHIAESRNSAVIPVKISKRSSTASNYSVRPLKYKSKSAETVDSIQACSQPFLETRSERHLPSRLSVNLAEIESRNHARRLSERGGHHVASAPPQEDYNLRNFEKSLLESKETTL